MPNPKIKAISKTKKIFNIFFVVFFVIFILNIFSINKANAAPVFNTKNIEIQKTLNQVLIPSPNLKTDGIIGTKSISAIKTFQKINKLKVDGVVGSRTHFSLRSAEIKENIKIQITLNQVLIPSPEIKINGVLGDNSIEAIKTFQANKNLVADGVIGKITRSALRETQLEEFAKIQIRLNQKLIPSPNLRIDGMLGTKSIEAIKTFQSNKNLVVDGIVGPITGASLRETEVSTVPSPTIPPVQTLPNITNPIIIRGGGGGGGHHIDPTLKDITTFSFDSLSVSGIISGNNISLTVPFATDITTLSPTILLTGGTVVPSSGTPQDFTDSITNPVIYTVTATDTSTKTYNVSVTVAPASSIATITSTSYTISSGGTPNETITNVQFGTSRLDFLSNISKGEVHQSWDSLNITDPVITNNTLVVTAQDGSVVTYTVTVLPPGANATITSTDYTVVSGATTGTITGVPYGVSKATFLSKITAGASGQSRNDTGVQDPVVTGDILIVTAQNGINQISYTITTELNSARAITGFDFNGLNPAVVGVIDEGAKTITLNVPFGTDLNLIPTIVHTGASILPASGASHNFVSTATYTVTASNGGTQDYLVTVNVGLSPIKTIDSFNFSSPVATGVIDEGNHTVLLTVPSGTNVTSIAPTITYTGALIFPTSGTAVDFTNPVTYTVTAVNGETQDYTVSVDVALSSSAIITSFKFNSLSPVVTGVINEGAKTITLTVPFGTNLNLTPTITYTGASIFPNSGVANLFVDGTPSDYVVTAADTVTQATYAVTVNVAPASSNATVTSTAYTVISGATTGTITGVPYGVSKATFLGNLIAGAVGQSRNDSGVSNPVTTDNHLIVTAQNTSTSIDYTITVVPNLSGNVTIDGTLKYGEILTANVSALTYDPADPQQEDIKTFQWKRGGVNIAGANSSTYTLALLDIGSTITVTVSSDGVNATGSRTSGATAVISKADGPAAPQPPTLSSKTATNITLTPNSLNEFNIDNGVWQNNVFNSLSPSTTYNFKARVKATATNLESSPSTGVDFTTEAQPTLPATAPVSAVLSVGDTTPVGEIYHVIDTIPVDGSSDSTGSIAGYASNVANKFKFTLQNGGSATSVITINGAQYISGTNYTISGAPTQLTIIVTTSEINRVDCVRTFVINIVTLTLADPSFSPFTGTFTYIFYGVTPVYISTNKPGATMYYTTDGSYPNLQSSSIISGSSIVTPAPSTTVRAIAVKAGYNGSNYSSAQYSQAAASTPVSFTLAPGNSNPVGGVTNVTMPAVGSTITTGLIAGYEDGVSNTIKFTVVNGGLAQSAITINGAAYSNGENYPIIGSPATITIQVITTETGGTSATRTMTIPVSKSCPGFPTVTDGGKTYETVLIGSQCWTRQNINIGTMVTGPTEQTNNSTFEKYCYNNDEANCDVYGGLYQWAEMVQYYNNATNTTNWSPVPTGNVQGICPANWHLPTQTEWDTLQTTLGGMAVAGGKMKEGGLAHFLSPNTGATNSSGFTALPGGLRYSVGATNGLFYYLTQDADFWTTTNAVGGAATDVYYRGASNSTTVMNNNQFYKKTGLSVRCIKD